MFYSVILKYSFGKKVNNIPKSYTILLKMCIYWNFILYFEKAESSAI